MSEQLYDVLIYKLEDKKIYRIVGERMALRTGFYNAEKRLETAVSKCNESFDAAIVETGKYKEQDVLKDSDIV